ncbi:hypothetical protein [Streptomyces sp. NPDC047070]|uniref:hypothetical protein n=1 Tax=Streptomyces sp. NPDC047070 TaxID=3154923 RepID=UPI003455FF19
MTCPRLFVLDEPASGLDEETAALLTHRLRRLTDETVVLEEEGVDATADGLWGVRRGLGADRAVREASPGLMRAGRTRNQR